MPKNPFSKKHLKEIKSAREPLKADATEAERAKRDLESRLNFAEMDQTCPKLNLDTHMVEQAELAIEQFLVDQHESDYVRISVELAPHKLEEGIRLYLEKRAKDKNEKIIEAFKREVHKPAFVVLLKK